MTRAIHLADFLAAGVQSTLGSADNTAYTLDISEAS